MIYLDSNVFVSAALYTDVLGDRAREIVGLVELGKVKAATSALTYDEVFWAVKKFKGRDAAVKAGDAFLSMLNLVMVNVDRDVLYKAHELIAGSGSALDPRDAIHAACALSKGINQILSEDGDFDSLNELKRSPIMGFKASEAK